MLGIIQVLVSKYTHLKRLIGISTSSEEFEVDEKRRSDPRRSCGRSQFNEVVEMEKTLVKSWS